MFLKEQTSPLVAASVWKKGLVSFQTEEPVKRSPVEDIRAPPDLPPLTLSVMTSPKDLPKLWHLSS